MKQIKKLFSILIIIPMICMCFVGCSKNKEVILTNENIKDYMVFNYTYDNIDGTGLCHTVFTISTTKKEKNITFKNCKFNFSFASRKGLSGNNQINIGPQLIHVDYNGVSKFSFYAIVHTDNLKDFDNYYEFKITDVSGAVIINN